MGHKWVMGNVVIPVVASMFVVASASGANMTCFVGKDCRIPCSFKGRIEKVVWFNGRDLIPIAFYPKDLDYSRRHDFRENVSLSVNQSAGDASLLLRGVPAQHQGTYRCWTNSSHETQSTLIHLIVSSETARDESNPSNYWIWILIAIIFILCALAAVITTCLYKNPCNKNTDTSRHTETVTSRSEVKSTQVPQENSPNTALLQETNGGALTGNGHTNGHDAETSV